MHLKKFSLVLTSEIDRKSNKFLLDLYKQESSTLVNKSLTWILKPESQGLFSQFTGLSKFTDLESFEWRGCLLLEVYYWKCILFFPSSLAQRDLLPFTWVTVNWGKGNIQTFQGLLETDSELTLIPGAPKYHCGLPVRIQIFNGCAGLSKESAFALLHFCSLQPFSGLDGIDPQLWRWSLYSVYWFKCYFLLETSSQMHPERIFYQLSGYQLRPAYLTHKINHHTYHVLPYPSILILHPRLISWATGSHSYCLLAVFTQMSHFTFRYNMYEVALSPLLIPQFLSEVSPREWWHIPDTREPLISTLFSI